MTKSHRNGPATWYGSNTVGIGGVSAASRISPEGSTRGCEMFNSEKCSHERSGYRRGGKSKQFQSPPPLPRETDIFLEAGRLAAEYLVSKGVLPHNALSRKWQNDGLKNQIGEVGKKQISVNRHVSAHPRSGNAVLDAESCRRRYFDELSSRDSVKRRRRSESLKIHGSEGNRELGKSESWSERRRSSPGMNADSDGSAGWHYEQSVGKDGSSGSHNSSTGEITNGGSGVLLESELEKHESVEDGGIKVSSFNNEKSLPSDAGTEPTMESNDANKSSEEFGKVNKGRNENDMEQTNSKNTEVPVSRKEDSLASVDNSNLVKDNKFVNDSIKAPSFLTIKCSSSVQDHMDEDLNISETEHSEAYGVYAMDVSADTSTDKASSYDNHELKNFDSDIVDCATEGRVPDVTYTTRTGDCLKSGSAYPEQKPGEWLTGFDSSSSLQINKGEKRAPDGDNDNMARKHREWFPSMDVQVDGSPPLFSSMENRPAQQEPLTSQSAHAALPDDQKSLNISLFSKGDAKTCELLEEKHLFPGSYKTWDLNLVGTCDFNENHDVANPVPLFPSVAESGKEVAIVDVGLSMNISHNLPNKKGKHGVTDCDIEVIDLEAEAVKEDKSLNDSKRRGDTMFTDLDGVRKVHNNANDIPKVWDGYGHMMAELFGNCSPHSSSVVANLHSLHSNMSQGIHGDDDSIYTSLGEIPSSLLGTWEHPAQDYGKPF